MNIYNIEDISALVRPSIVTVGMFDGVHVGHAHLLELLLRQAAALQLEPWVVTFDRHPRLVLHGDVEAMGLLSTPEERMARLEKCGVHRMALVHFTPALAALSACQFVQQFLLRQLNMKALVLGYDNMFGNKQHNDFERLPALAQEEGFAIFHDTAVYVEGVEVSSTKVRRALQDGDMQLAQRLLGAYYSVRGRVVHGRGVGRRLGYPTANIVAEDRQKALPAEGVYAVHVSDGNKQWRGMASLGSRPTFGLDSATLEVHLFNCHEALYGTVLRVEFVKRLRGIIRFEDEEALAAQLAKDKGNAMML